MAYLFCQGAPLNILLIWGGGGGGTSKWFLGSEILAKRDFFGSMKDTGIFLGHEKNTRQGFFLKGIIIVIFISSNQQKRKRNLLLVWDFCGYTKKIVIFLGRQILKLGFFQV